MSNLHYNWTRLWRPRGEAIEFWDGGFPVDPASELGLRTNGKARALSRLDDVQCLVMLGEMGAGKSDEIEGAFSRIKAVLPTEDTALFFDLGEYQTDHQLIQDLFLNPNLLSWLAGKGNLWLFLDALDEGMLEIGPLARILAREIRKLPTKRLSLRISCRTADWPLSLETDLDQIWDASFAVFELDPLNRSNVTQAAVANGLDPDEFVRTLEIGGAVPMALKPVTLDFLFKTYHKRDIPAIQTELYETGCLELCRESEQRVDSQHAGRLSPEQRLAVASRIAAAMVFGNRAAIWTMVTDKRDDSDSLTLADICGGVEDVGGIAVEISHQTVRETLRFGLFRSRGAGRAGWAHKTYAEFLAARYLQLRRMPLKQKKQLICIGGAIVPQLKSTSAWLAVMDADLFEVVARAEPQILLASDVVPTGREFRKRLVDSLLSWYEAEEGPPRWLEALYYGKLCYDELGDQLRPWLTEPDGGEARLVAVQMAAECGVRAVEHELLAISLDPNEATVTRRWAIVGLRECGSPNVLVRLRPVALGQAGEDPNDVLKGEALMALWPGSLSADELFACLTPPLQHYGGPYDSFISSLNDKLQPSDLNAALKWVEGNPSRSRMAWAFAPLADAVMSKAWDSLDRPSILASFANAVASRVRLGDPIIGETPGSAIGEKGCDASLSALEAAEPGKRRSVVERVLDKLSETPDKLWHFPTSIRPLLHRDDLIWLIDQYRIARKPALKSLFLTAARSAFTWEDPDLVDTVFEACHDDETLRKMFGLYNSVNLGSPEAAEMKSRHDELMRDPRSELPPVEPPPAERVASWLNACDAGDCQGWWRLNMELTLEPYSQTYGSDLESDLTALPGWGVADDSCRSRIVSAAFRYVQDCEPGDSSWLEDGSIDRRQYAGYRALKLLAFADMDRLLSLGSNVWKKWALITLAFPRGATIGEKGSRETLIRLAYERAPDDVVAAASKLVNATSTYGGTRVIDELECCWDQRIKRFVRAAIDDETLAVGRKSALLGRLLEHKVDGIRSQIEELVASALERGESGIDDAVSYAIALVIHEKDAGWMFLWPWFLRYPALAERVIQAAARWDVGAAILCHRLAERQIADLFLWLVTRFPGLLDYIKGRGGYGSAGDTAFFCDGLLQSLISMGTERSYVEVQRIASTLTGHVDLRRQVVAAMEATRRNTWAPPTPSDVVALALNADARVVNDGGQLLDVLMESLERLEVRLQSENPMSFALWDSNRPKAEEFLSDFIKDHFDNDVRKRGIVVAREVRIISSGKTDIHVTAIRAGSPNSSADTIKAILEVKGRWNADVNEAMRRQLVDRYLAETGCVHGLYVVGWYGCEQWTAKDSRRAKHTAEPLNACRARYDEQAMSLCDGSRDVRAFVLNAALPRPAPRRAGKAGRAKNPNPHGPNHRY